MKRHSDIKYRKNGKNRCLILAAAIIVLFILVRFGVFFAVSGGFSGIAMAIPLFFLGVIFFWLLMSAFFGAWVYQDCRKRGDDPVLWVIIIFLATPVIGLLIYFLRRREIKRPCPACGHPVPLRAKYCEECGAYIKNREEMERMENKKVHHKKYIAGGLVSLALLIVCLTVVIVSASGAGNVNTDPSSNERVWNLGVIQMSVSNYWDGVWNFSFKRASDGFVEERNMKIEDAETQKLHADISCGTVPDGASLILWLVQGDRAESVDVTDLSKPLEYPLDGFEEGKIHVRLQINGVEDVTSEITIE